MSGFDGFADLGHTRLTKKQGDIGKGAPHVVPDIGRIRLAKLTPADVQAFLTK